MALHSLLVQEHVQIVFDDVRRLVMLELSSGGYRERYVTAHFDDPADIDRIIAALEEAKRRLTGAARE